MATFRLLIAAVLTICLMVCARQTTYADVDTARVAWVFTIISAVFLLLVAADNNEWEDI